MLICIIFIQPPYINLQRYHDKFFTFESVLTSRIRITFQNAEVNYHYFIFKPITKNPLLLGASSWVEFRSLFTRKSYNVWSTLMSRIQNSFQNVEVYNFLQPPSINFLRYHEKSFTARSIFMSRTEINFLNVEVYYFPQPPSTNFLR